MIKIVVSDGVGPPPPIISIIIHLIRTHRVGSFVHFIFSMGITACKILKNR
jgi:hypothetical protein